MVPDIDTVSKSIGVNYPSNNGEIPIGFLVHNKGLWGSSLQEYFFVSINGSHALGGVSISCSSINTTATYSTFNATVRSSAPPVSSSVEIAPIYASDLGLT